MKASDFGRNLPLKPSGRVTEKNENEIRQEVLLETLEAFEKVSDTRYYHKLAMANLKRWRENIDASFSSSAKNSDGGSEPKRCKVEVVSGDWGAVTLNYTKEYGTMFAVLNMANAHSPGGGYTDGCAAQEENMFRRTDCHFSVDRSDKDVVNISSNWYADYDAEYTPTMTNLLNGKEGKVYLDTASPRVCIREQEDLQRDDLGYDFLPEDCFFPFMELRSAAVDRRGHLKSYLQKNNSRIMEDMRNRIAAQLETLMEAGVRHVVLSAFGCGAFRNPADGVACLYREEIEKRASYFDIVVFAIFHAGYGPDNFTPFQREFQGFNGEAAKSVPSESARYETPPKERTPK